MYGGNKVLRQIIIAYWKKKGRPYPPPSGIKQLTIEKYSKMFNCSILVETGTFLGNMIISQFFNFKKIYSIELSEELYKKALKIFKYFNKITLINGDSGKELYKIIPTLHNRTIFWLDAHYSGGITAKGSVECPVTEELKAILSNNKYKHIILIDDANDFKGFNSYPSIEELRILVAR
ncbi:MAG: hypothetical protein N2449_05525, partial [Bacteroidales bacterium]|nr:hypothetical protein [Bacteroidales bacterium]